MSEWCPKCNKYHDMTTAGTCPQAGSMISPILSDAPDPWPLVRELRDALKEEHGVSDMNGWMPVENCNVCQLLARVDAALERREGVEG